MRNSIKTVPAWELDIAVDELGRCIGTLASYNHPLVPLLETLFDALKEELKALQPVEK
jgi:hypothetical protein